MVTLSRPLLDKARSTRASTTSLGSSNVPITTHICSAGTSLNSPPVYSSTRSPGSTGWPRRRQSTAIAANPDRLGQDAVVRMVGTSSSAGSRTIRTKATENFEERRLRTLQVFYRRHVDRVIGNGYLVEPLTLRNWWRPRSTAVLTRAKSYGATRGEPTHGCSGSRLGWSPTGMAKQLRNQRRQPNSSAGEIPTANDIESLEEQIDA